MTSAPPSARSASRGSGSALPVALWGVVMAGLAYGVGETVVQVVDLFG